MYELVLPHNTEAGKKLVSDFNNIEKPLLELIVKNKYLYSMSYEFSYDDNIEPVFIVNREEEKDIPPFNIPLVVETNNKKYIVSNLTGLLRSGVSTKITSEVKNDFATLEIVRNVLLYNALSGHDHSYLISMVSQVATRLFTTFISKQLRLSTYTTVELEGAIFYYLINKYSECSDNDIKPKFISFLSGYKYNKEKVNEVLSRLGKLDKHNLSLAECIHACTDDHLLKDIELSTIIAMLSNKWYSGTINSSLQIILALEDFHTMAGIIYHSAQTPTGKKTLFGNVLKDNARHLKLKQLLSTIDNRLEEVKL